MKSNYKSIGLNMKLDPLLTASALLGGCLQIFWSVSEGNSFIMMAILCGTWHIANIKHFDNVAMCSRKCWNVSNTGDMFFGGIKDPHYIVLF